ncbi:MAG: D-alanyl-D-alanine carboxypeptidase [Actinobacteria bacterium]|nr:D-alanyl-D-alanine carboxypeptidase [Actinomycetota bacterium]
MGSKAALDSPARRTRAVVFAALVLVAGLALLSTVPAGAADGVTRTVTSKTVDVRTPRMPTGVSMKAGIVSDAATGRALWAMHPRQKRLIASTTKTMTALVALSRSEPGDVLRATSYRHDAAESVLGLKPGEKMTVRDLLAALMLYSANDAADTLALRLGGGSRANFVAAMNRRARALGMTDTVFGNPVGLDTPLTQSTARDMAKLAAAAMDDPELSAIVGRKRATLRSGSRTRRIVNRNKLVLRHDFVDGVKTGHTMKAGYLLVGSATKDDARVVSVVMGAPTEAARDRDSLKLLRFGRAFFKSVEPVSSGRTITDLPVALQDIEAPVYAKRDVRFALRDGERYRVEVVTTSPELEGPLAAGTRVGTVRVTRNGREAVETPVYLRKGVPEPPVAAVMLDLLQRFLPVMLGLAVVFIIGLLLMRRRARQSSKGIGRTAARATAP